MFFYLRKSQITADPWVDASPEPFAIISSTIDISTIWIAHRSSPGNSNGKRSSTTWWSKVGDENKQVGILTFICINMGTQNTVNIEYSDFLRRAQNLKKIFHIKFDATE